jgi:DNA-binding PadR family transcriptional regulator
VAARRPVSNPLALAVLACLYERPMHPYEMATTMRERGKEQSIKLNYGSLYTVVDNLTKHGLIEAIEARREGRRPERTVYRITDPGRAELDGWMSELLAVPVKEYTQFEAALSLMPVVHPDKVHALLRDRVSTLAEKVAANERLLQAYRHGGLPRLMLIEAEYEAAMVTAELAWVRGLVEEIEAGTFEDFDGWRRWHETGAAPEVRIDHEAVDAYLGQGTKAGPGVEGGAATT